MQTQIRLLRSSLIRVYTVCNSLCIFWMHYSKQKPSCSTFRAITANFRVSKMLGFLRYNPELSEYVDWYTIYRSTNMLISRLKTICRSRYYMSIGCYAWLYKLCKLNIILETGNRCEPKVFEHCLDFICIGLNADWLPWLSSLKDQQDRKKTW